MPDLIKIDDLIDGRTGTHDVPCPLCGPHRKRVNQRRTTLRIWRKPDGFAAFYCAHCEASGYEFGPNAHRLRPTEIERTKQEHAAHRRQEIQNSQDKARWLWSRRQPIKGSIAETYLRACRGYRGMLPATFGFLPTHGKYDPAMIAAFGLAKEVEPDIITIDDDAIRGVHLTRLKPDGSGKADGAAKVTIGKDHTMPIVLHPPTDLLALVVTEGIEDGLSAHEALGMGAWAAGSASRLPLIAEHIPDYIETVTIMVDVDPDGTGERHAEELAARLDQRGVEVSLVPLGVAV